MNCKKMTDQQLADEIKATIWAAIDMGNEAIARACNQAATSPAAAVVVPNIVDMVGHLLHAHASATRAANDMPGIVPAFGGK